MWRSEQVTDGDIVANILHELDPEPEEVNSDDDDDDEADSDYIGNTSQFLHTLSHQRAFMQQNKFPTEVLKQLQALEQANVHHQIETCMKQASLMSFFK